MSQVTVTIAGRTYRIACGDGEEEHLKGLAAFYDGKIEDMRAAFGEIGDMRLHVMAAITLADEFVELRRRMELLERERDALRAAASDEERQQLGQEERMAQVLTRAAERIERLARGLNAPSQADQG